MSGGTASSGGMALAQKRFLNIIASSMPDTTNHESESALWLKTAFSSHIGFLLDQCPRRIGDIEPVQQVGIVITRVGARVVMVAGNLVGCCGATRVVVAGVVRST